ncbi:hypothetical protein BDL97_03G005900 [Sphagnum fallax]|nr:hypothetical protein BDL97_03G005900 [Sphagnum fallax]
MRGPDREAVRFGNLDPASFAAGASRGDGGHWAEAASQELGVCTGRSPRSKRRSCLCPSRTPEGALPSFPLLCNSTGSALLSEIFFAFFGAKFADILNAPCLLSSAAKVLSFLAFVCGKEEDPRGGGLDSLWCTNNKPFFDDEASVAF